MSVSSAPGHWAQARNTDNPPRFVRRGKFGVDVPGYTGPEDGKSHPKFPSLMKAVNHAMTVAEYREEVEGADNLPHSKDDVYLYASSHPTYFDPVVVADVIPGRNLRFVANEKAFDGVRGTYMTLGGAFPVDLDWGRLTTVRHAIDLVESGKKLVIYPEGKISEDFETIERLKRGAAAIARLGGAKGIVPIAVHYERDVHPRVGERAAGGLMALGTGLALAAAGTLGGTLALGAGALGLGLAGAFAGGKLGRKLDPKARKASYTEPFDRYFAGLDGLVKGAATGLLAGAATTALAPAALPALAILGGLGVIGFSEALASRPLARVKIGEPILLEKHSDPARSRKENDIEVTRALHQAIGGMKAELTGVPYDENSKKVFDLSEKPIYDVPEEPR